MKKLSLTTLLLGLTVSACSSSDSQPETNEKESLQRTQAALSATAWSGTWTVNKDSTVMSLVCDGKKVDVSTPDDTSRTIDLLPDGKVRVGDAECHVDHTVSGNVASFTGLSTCNETFLNEAGEVEMVFQWRVKSSTLTVSADETKAQQVLSADVDIGPKRCALTATVDFVKQPFVQ